MNKKELIKKYEETIYVIVATNEVLKDLKQLDDEKEKVTLPRPVGNWISCVRGRNKTLHFALENALEEVIMASLPNKELNRLIKIEIAVENLIENGILDEDVYNKYLNEV